MSCDATQLDWSAFSQLQYLYLEGNKLTVSHPFYFVFLAWCTECCICIVCVCVRQHLRSAALQGFVSVPHSSRSRGGGVQGDAEAALSNMAGSLPNLKELDVSLNPDLKGDLGGKSTSALCQMVTVRAAETRQYTRMCHPCATHMQQRDLCIFFIFFKFQSGARRSPQNRVSAAPSVHRHALCHGLFLLEE